MLQKIPSSIYLTKVGTITAVSTPPAKHSTDDVTLILNAREKH